MPRLCLWMAIILAAGLALPVSPALAQREQMSIRRPARLRSRSRRRERLAPQFQRQLVLLPHKRGAGHHHRSYVRAIPLCRAAQRPRACATASALAATAFNGRACLHITRKQEWPDWTPPPEMIERQPYLPRFMAGGPGNPMGARALYLGDDGLSHSRHQSAADDRQRRFVGMLPPGQWRRDRPLRSHSGRDQGHRPAEAGTVTLCDEVVDAQHDKQEHSSR